MTESAAIRRPPARRPSLYRTVLSLLVAAVVATSLPFSVMAVGALTQRPTLVTHTGSGPRLLTTASGSTVARSVPGSVPAAGAVVRVTTRTS